MAKLNRRLTRFCDKYGHGDTNFGTVTRALSPEARKFLRRLVYRLKRSRLVYEGEPGFVSKSMPPLKIVRVRNNALSPGAHVKQNEDGFSVHLSLGVDESGEEVLLTVAVLFGNCVLPTSHPNYHQSKIDDWTPWAPWTYLVSIYNTGETLMNHHSLVVPCGQPRYADFDIGEACRVWVGLKSLMLRRIESEVARQVEALGDGRHRLQLSGVLSHIGLLVDERQSAAC